MKKRKSAIENYRERKVSSGWLTLNILHLSLLGCWLFLVLRRSFHRVSCFRKKKTKKWIQEKKHFRKLCRELSVWWRAACGRRFYWFNRMFGNGLTLEKKTPKGRQRQNEQRLELCSNPFQYNSFKKSYLSVHKRRLVGKTIRHFSSSVQHVTRTCFFEHLSCRLRKQNFSVPPFSWTTFPQRTAYS